ncbi:MAG: Coenzyme F420 hydrogenase/dehydrogenase, beta subunit C-terminal domain [Acetatifactor sp.]|nr:Coenzyme F420 hydrogenase/dehydrogenase, beta subunit C-terminal domain [Acetatifactor sp.]
MITEICSRDICLGCALCESVCPKNAIAMEIQDGFYRPTISTDCISCSICINNCPANNRDKIQKNCIPETAYAAWCKDDNIHFESSSGGVAYKIAYEFIKKGGAVIGIWFNPETQRVEHRIYENVNNLHLMRGSRYVQSSKAGIYKAAVNKLNEKDVLFIGVPCEVHAMKLFAQGKQLRHQLLCIDMLCRGGSSPRCLAEHMKKISFRRIIKNVTFRGGKYDCRFSVWGNNDRMLYSVGQYTDPYFLMFMKRSIYQNACYDCSFAGAERVGDITLGDFWGLDEQVKRRTTVRGINMLFINTEAGKQIIQQIEPDIIMIPRPVQEAIEGNDTLKEPTSKPAEYEKLWKQINYQGFHRAIKVVYGIDWRKMILIWYAKAVRAKAAKVLRGK